jgi:hypothetical protein
MKLKLSSIDIITLFVVGAGVFGLAGCTEMAANNTKSQLSAAGFQVRTPQTPKQQQLYAALPNQQIQRAHVNGKVFYVFKDEKEGVAYVGHEPEYQRYQQLCIQQQIAQQYYMAAEMNSYYARGWYGAWGPRAIYW